MNSWAFVCIEIFAVLAVIVAIPLYMGFVHLGVVEMVAYVFVGGFSMAVGESIQDRDLGLDLFAGLLHDLGLWMMLVGVVGGLFYTFALLFL